MNDHTPMAHVNRASLGFRSLELGHWAFIVSLLNGILSVNRREVNRREKVRRAAGARQRIPVPSRFRPAHRRASFWPLCREGDSYDGVETSSLVTKGSSG